MSRFISTFTQTSVLIASSTVPCAARRHVASVMASTTCVDKYPTKFRLAVAQPSSIASGTLETGSVARRSARAALVTLAEHISQYTVIRHIHRKTAEAVCNTVAQGLTPHKNQVHTTTFNNNHEFADHEGKASDFENRINFAHPHDSWERGLNENTNDLIRAHLPKHRDLTTATERDLDKAVDKFTHRPRNLLCIRTPDKVFFNTKTSLTIALQS